MSAMTCLACNVGFEDVALGRHHYKTDWHRYNLKRKVAQLPPVTLEKFEERQQLQVNQQEQTGHETCLCKPCNKAFSSTNAYENHLQSKKHKDVISGAYNQKKGKKKVVKQQATGTSDFSLLSNNKGKEEKTTPAEAMSSGEDDSDVESWDSYDENTIGIEECLFCSNISSSLEENITHMTSQHGFFLPDAEYISDLEGLITYLGEKVGAGHICLWCNEKGKRFHHTKDVQRHMIDKGHCKMLHEGDVVFEYADYYDYMSSYPDGQNPDVNADETVNTDELQSDGYTLTLPSGATIGHRSLMRYYQQNLVPHLHEPTKKILPKMLAYYKALGWTGSTGSQVVQRAKDLHYMQRLRNRYHTQLGCKANNLRHRFRDPNGLI